MYHRERHKDELELGVQGDECEVEREASSNEVTAENILELVIDINPWTQKNLQFSSSINKKKPTPMHFTVKLQKIKENLKSWNLKRENYNDLQRNPQSNTSQQQ